MREPTLKKTALVSALLHLLAFVTTMVLLQHSNQFVMPSPYTVNLVSPDTLRKSAAVRSRRAASVKEPVKSSDKKSVAVKPKEDDLQDRQHIQEMINAIEAKKKIERIVKLRNMISLKRGDDRLGKSAKTSSTHGKGDLSDDYYRKITREIWQQWVYPETSRKDIEAIVAVKILKDGTALVQRIEKSSGNLLFDRAALKALAKASPLEPPPYEMEIGVRFYP